jgi:hypothetical protein
MDQPASAAKPAHGMPVGIEFSSQGPTIMDETTNLELANLEKVRRTAALAFQQWDGYVSGGLVKASRDLFQQLIESLIALGSTPSVTDVLFVLQSFIEAMNRLDSENGHWITTVEREDICEALDRVIELTGLQDREELDEGTIWRDW